MDSETMSQALDAIHDEALKLTELDLPDDAARMVELIISIARYKMDVRTDAEKHEEIAI